ncbi:MAG: two-component sensor histidine kinase [Lachnospiraceae bacterium]|nr:two-component sensor histidine kinase [Lachnospiraceae bacterium]
MKRKINIRLIGIALLAMLVTLFGVSSIYYHLFQKQVRRDLHIFAKILVDSNLFQKDKVEELVFDSSDIRITWIDNNGDVLYDNWASKETMENHLERPEVKKAFETGKGTSIRVSDTFQINTYYYALQMKDNTVIRVAMNIKSMLSIIFTFLPFIFLIVGMIVVLCIFIADYLTKRILRPINILTENLEVPTESTMDKEVYKELIPFMETIRVQHENILAAAKMRQDFTANVSHELKTPLTAIAGYAELIETGMADEAKGMKFAGEIRKNSDRLLTLINDIIRLSELDSIEDFTKTEMMDLYALAEDCSENLRVNAKRRGISFTLRGSKCMIRGNVDMMHKLIENLCENAIRYNNESGYVILTVTSENGKNCLIVEDNGIGISKEHQERVFERFYRVDKSRSKETGGTGLGLAIVKHIVAIHGASISLESEVGKGTKVTVVF